MQNTEPLPAIHRIDTDREDLCALEIVGHLTAADLENIYGLLEAGYEQHDKIDLLLRITRYEGFDWSAAFDQSTLRAKTQALRHIRKYAIVGGPVWMRFMLGVFGRFSPVTTRHFAVEDEAWEWIGGRPVASE